MVKTGEIYRAIPNRDLNAVMIIKIIDPNVSELSTVVQIYILYSNENCQELGGYQGLQTSLVLKSWNLEKIG